MSAWISQHFPAWTRAIGHSFIITKVKIVYSLFTIFVIVYRKVPNTCYLYSCIIHIFSKTFLQEAMPNHRMRSVLQVFVNVVCIAHVFRTHHVIFINVTSNSKLMLPSVSGTKNKTLQKKVSDISKTCIK